MKSRQLTKLLPLLCLLGSFLPAVAADYYVNPKGADYANGSQSSPWQTISHAAGEVKAGDSVNVLPGDYSEMVTIRQSGSDAAPIVFKSVEAHGAKLKGFKLTGDYITIEGFDISNDQANGVGIDAGEAHRETARTGCKMIGNFIHDVQGTAINVGINGVAKGNLMKNVGRGIFVNSGGLVENNEVDTLMPVFIEKKGKTVPKKTQYCFFSGDDIVFRGNYLHGTEEKYLIAGMGVCFFTSYDAWIYPSSHNILVENNRCFNATHASEPSAEKQKDSSRFIYRNNLFVNTVYVGIFCKGVAEVIVENNTFVNCGAYPVWFANPREAKDSVVRNNIIAYYERDRVVQEFGWKPAESGIRNNVQAKFPIVAENNLFWNTSNRGYGTNNIEADPMFVDPANNDFRLQAGSPAINAGVQIAEIQTDVRGVARPQNGSLDIGSYEYSTQDN